MVMGGVLLAMMLGVELSKARSKRFMSCFGDLKKGVHKNVIDRHKRKIKGGCLLYNFSKGAWFGSEQQSQPVVLKSTTIYYSVTNHPTILMLLQCLTRNNSTSQHLNLILQILSGLFFPLLSCFFSCINECVLLDGAS